MAKKTQADFVTLLNVGQFRDKNKQQQVLNARIIGLGLGNVCGRCGGCGNYSFNQINGTTCFGCGGTGYVAAKLSDDLYARLEVMVNDGSFAKYLDDLRARAALRNACKGAVDEVMAAWRACNLGSFYDWTKAAKGLQPHRQISDEVNKPMADAYTATQKAVSAAESLGYQLKKVTTEAERLALNEKISLAMQSALEVRDQSLAVIASGKVRLAEILANQPS